MVSVAELLNPAPPAAPRASLPTSRPLLSPDHRRTVAFPNEPAPGRPLIETLRIMDNTNNPSRCKAKAVINFPPFEVLDEHSIREVRRFQVHPFGSIQETCERIPYNSGKKDFFSKTGREGFEAFHYDFKIPGDDTNYTVMWDYSVGLVRMTSFFKCRGYSKTTPAKMLNLNSGLKDITYSITGGSIKAQGYWMPFACAKAICATFCHKISGALIPLFGPQFPLECIPEKAPGHGRMVIDPEIVDRATIHAAALFRPTAALPSPRSSRSVSPLPSHRSAHASGPYDYYSDHDQRLPISPYTDTDVDYRPVSDHHSRHPFPTSIPPLRIPTSRPTTGPAPAPTPQHSPGWTAVNQAPPQLHPAYPHHRCATSHLHEELLGLNVSASANPWLSAVPRSPTPGIGGGSSSSASRWHPYPPRSHNHHQHCQYPTHDTSPVSASLPEWGITLPPLRLKRRFSKVDTTTTTTTTTDKPNNHPTEHGNEDEDVYDASSSQAGAGSPLSVSAPPPTPTPTPASEAAGKPTATTPSPAHVHASITVVTSAATPGGGGGNTARRASERDAAMMLMQMCSLSQSQSRGGSSEDDRGFDGGGGGGDGREGHTSPMAARGAVQDGKMVVGSGGNSATAAARDTATAVAVAAAVRPSSWTPSAAVAVAVAGESDSPPRPPAAPISAGPTTRSKRRRTLER